MSMKARIFLAVISWYFLFAFLTKIMGHSMVVTKFMSQALKSKKLNLTYAFWWAKGKTTYYSCKFNVAFFIFHHYTMLKINICTSTSQLSYTQCCFVSCSFWTDTKEHIGIYTSGFETRNFFCACSGAGKFNQILWTKFCERMEIVLQVYTSLPLTT